MNNDIQNIISAVLEEFELKGEIINIKPLTEGHINTAYMVEFDDNTKYTVQRVNTGVFKDPVLLMDNITAVTSHLKRKISGNGGDPSRETLSFLKAKDGSHFLLRDDGCWRVYDFIDEVYTIGFAGDKDSFRKAGAGFGAFQNHLSDYDGSSLGETIPDFHNTPVRFENLKKAIEADIKDRVKDCSDLIDFALDHEAFTHTATDLIEKGLVPIRVTHNDTKINNILFDKDTDEPICVIDLDTVMPGLAMYDFGDAIRSGAATAAEDEKDLEKVGVDLSLFSAYADGYLSVCGKSLTEKELETLHLGAPLMALECGMRFLTDYLEGDVYFRTLFPEQNLIRARNQFKLVSDMESKLDEMKEIIKRQGE